MKWARCTPCSSSGLTLVELLVAITVSSMIFALVLPLILSHHRLVTVDQARTSVFQTLRSAMDLVGTDVRIAGERLEQRGGPGIMPIAIDTGEAGASDELVLRRNLLDYVLPVCDEIKAGSSENNIKIRNNSLHNYPECQREHPSAGWPPELLAWKEYREGHGGAAGQVRAYIYSPLTKLGEFFIYDDEDASKFQIHRLAGADSSWAYDYEVNKNANPPHDLSRLYILEERRYRLNADGVLEVIVNGDFANPQSIAGGITRFTVRAIRSDGSVMADLSTSAHWRELMAIEITLDAQAAARRETVDRTLTSRFFPRNVLSGL